jgi:hypothetical protein
MPELHRIDGHVHLLKPVEERGANGFRVRELVLLVDADSQRPQYVTVEAIFEMLDELDRLPLAQGDPVVAHVSVGGRHWTNPQGEDRFFNTVRLEKIQTLVDRDAHAAEAEPADEEDIGF